MEPAHRPAGSIPRPVALGPRGRAMERRRLRHGLPGRVAGLLALVLHGLAAEAQLPLLPDEIERNDVIAIERDGRELFAFDALTGRRALIRLDVAETVLFEASRGRIGVVLTDKRVLGVSPGTSWLEARLRIHEAPAEVALVEDRLALTVTDRRALAFTGAGWIEEPFSPEETAVTMRAGSAAGVITTNRRLLAAAPLLAGFVAQKLRLREVLESVTAQDTLVTLRTDRRILVFSAPRARWSEEKLRLH